MEKKIYLIEGIIFQRNQAWGLGEKPGIGTAVMIKEVMNYAIYNGIAGPVDETQKTFEGSMNDLWGKSSITDFKISDNELSFIKHYEGGRPGINYRFIKKEGNAWIGKYSGPDCGEGPTKCIVTLIDESFFVPPK